MGRGTSSRNQTVWIALLGVALFVGGLGAADVKGQNDREGEEQIHKIQQRLKELVDSGRNDDAARVKQEIKRLVEQSHHRLDNECSNHSDVGKPKQNTHGPESYRELI